MKKYIIYLLLMLALPSGLSAQFTATVGTTGGADYQTLQAVFDAINNGSVDAGGGAITLYIIASTTETGTAVLYPGGYSGFTDYSSVLIYPTGSGYSISGNLNMPLIEINGASNVTFDGRVNQAGAADLIITNTSTGSSASTFRFTESANANTVKYCYIKGSGTSSTSGIILFSTSSSGGGNSSITIDHNYITNSADANRPYNAIYSAGSAGYENTGNIISYNNFYDFLNKGVTSNGILLSSYSSSWTISNNSFYETALFAPVSSVSYYVIQINNTSGNNFSVSGNYIGGSSSSCGGSAWTKTSAYDNTFSAIYLNVGNSGATNVQGNTIRNFAWSNSANASWMGMDVEAGAVNIGTTTGNTIGASTGTGSVTVAGGTSNTIVYGINIAGSGTVDCENNSIGSITAANSNNNNATHFYGINKTAVGGTTTISNNTIGSTTSANSINASSAGSSNAQNVFGICNAGTSNVTISNNTIANLTNATTNPTAGTAGLINGIKSSDGTNIISNNVVRDLTISNASTASNNTASVCGIALTGTTLKTVSGNTIYNLVNNFSSFAGNITGLYFTGNTGANAVNDNFIYGLSATGASSTAASLYGIQVNAGATTYANNILSLGANSQTTIYGIYETGAAANNNNLYFNTIYIGGSPGSGTNKSYALYSAVTTNSRDFRNNIFVNARSTTGGSYLHYSIYIVSTGGTITCDYNNCFVSGTGGYLGYYGGNVGSLPIVSGQDANSLAIDPTFTTPGGINASDYIPASAYLPGVTGTGITVDYNGAARAATPTMGAFEGGGSCTNPTTGGTISGSQSGCNPFTPVGFSNTAPASGYTGASLEYKWQQSTTSSSTGFSDIASSNSATYSAGSLTQTTWFKRLARVTCIGSWTGAAESNVLMITVNPLPNIGLTVGGTGSVCSGTGSNITVASSESGVNYQLRNGILNIGSPVAGNGGTISLPTGNLTSTTVFNVLATNVTTSCFAQLSQTATVTINTLPNTGLAVGGTGSVCNGSSSNITVALSENGVNYQLRNGGVNVGTAVAGNGGTINLPTGSMTFNITFNVLAINTSTTCSAQLSQTATVSVNPLPNNSLSVGGSGGVCSGTGTIITVDLTETGVNYQLRNGVVNIGSPVAGNGGTVNLSTGNLTSTTTFNILASNASSGCSVQLSQTATVSVNALPNTGLTVGGTGSVCTGTGTNVTVALSESGVNYQLRNGVVNVGSVVAGNGSTINLSTGNLTSTTTFNILAATISTGCSAQLTQTATVTVNPVSVGGSISGTSSITYGSSTGTMTLSGYTGIIQRWEKRLNSGGWTTISNTNSTYSETPSSAGIWGYRAVVKSGACSEANSSEYSVTVNKATPVITWGNPADIVENTPLSSTQLNATADVTGTFIYTPAAGVILSVGPNQTLSVSFTPDDAVDYSNANKSVLINVITLTGIADVQHKEVNIYPNPTKGLITIEGLTSVSNDKIVTLYISDNFGKTILRKSLERNISSATIDISQYANGSYFIVLQTDKGKIVKQFVKQ